MPRREEAELPSGGGEQPRDASGKEGASEAAPEALTQAVGGGCQSGCGAVTVSCKMPLKLALAVRETGAGHRPGALERWGGGSLPSNASLEQASHTHHEVVTQYCRSIRRPNWLHATEPHVARHHHSACHRWTQWHWGVGALGNRAGVAQIRVRLSVPSDNQIHCWALVSEPCVLHPLPMSYSGGTSALVWSRLPQPQTCWHACAMVVTRVSHSHLLNNSSNSIWCTHAMGSRMHRLLGHEKVAWG